MGLAEWFKTFCSNIQVQDGGMISIRHKAITLRAGLDCRHPAAGCRTGGEMIGTILISWKT